MYKTNHKHIWFFHIFPFYCMLCGNPFVPDPNLVEILRRNRRAGKHRINKTY